MLLPSLLLFDSCSRMSPLNPPRPPMAQGPSRRPAPGKALTGTALGWAVSAKLPVHCWLRLAQIHDVLVFTPNKSSGVWPPLRCVLQDRHSAYHSLSRFCLLLFSLLKSYSPLPKHTGLLYVDFTQRFTKSGTVKNILRARLLQPAC